VNLLKKIGLVILVTAWLPATSHCLLVALSGLESLACCASDSFESTASPDENCDGDACAAVEAGFYKLETVQVAAPQPMLELALFESGIPDKQLSSPQSTQATVSIPLELRPSLHFRMRASLPARAPTLPC